MTRNLDYRVEAVAPVEATELREQLRFVLEASLSDNRRRWMMRSDGSYERVSTDDGPVRDIQETLMAATEAALDRGYGPGMAVDPDRVDEELLVEDAGESEPDADSAEPDETAPDDDRGRPHSDGGDASVFDAYAEHW